MSNETRRCRNCGDFFAGHHSLMLHCWDAPYEWDTTRLSNTRWLPSADGAAACLACMQVRAALLVVTLSDGSNGFDPAIPKVCQAHDREPWQESVAAVSANASAARSAFAEMARQVAALGEAFAPMLSQPMPITSSGAAAEPEPVRRLRALLSLDRRLCMNCAQPLSDHRIGGQCVAVPFGWLPSFEGARDCPACKVGWIICAAHKALTEPGVVAQQQPSRGIALRDEPS